MISFLEKNRFVALVLAILVAVEIFYFSSIEFEKGISVSILGLSMLYHFSVFFLFNFFLMVSTNGRGGMKIKYILMALVVSALYSILDEIHQIFVPFRNPSLSDIMIDFSGIMISGLAYIYYKAKSLKE